MFEQAVYAGRNHTVDSSRRRLRWPSARPRSASDVARVPLGSAIEALVAGPDGGAWIGIQHRSRGAIGRAGADGELPLHARRAPAPRDGTIGPDGQAWFSIAGERLARVDAAGHVALIRPYWTLGDDALGGGLATGPGREPLDSDVPDGAGACARHAAGRRHDGAAALSAV